MLIDKVKRAVIKYIIEEKKRLEREREAKVKQLNLFGGKSFDIEKHNADLNYLSDFLNYVARYKIKDVITIMYEDDTGNLVCKVKNMRKECEKNEK